MSQNRGWEECLGDSSGLGLTPLFWHHQLIWHTRNWNSASGDRKKRTWTSRLSGLSSFKQSYGSHRNAQFLKHEIALQSSSQKTKPHDFNCHPYLGEQSLSTQLYRCCLLSLELYVMLMLLVLDFFPSMAILLRMWDSSFLITPFQLRNNFFIKSTFCVYVSNVIMWCLRWQCKHCSEKCHVACDDYLCFPYNFLFFLELIIPSLLSLLLFNWFSMCL